MTVITVIAIAAIAGLFYAFVWPMIQQSLVQNTCKTMGDGWTATKTSGTNCVEAKKETGGAGGNTWYCCPPTE